MSLKVEKHSFKGHAWQGHLAFSGLEEEVFSDSFLGPVGSSEQRGSIYSIEKVKREQRKPEKRVVVNVGELQIIPELLYLP